MKPPLFDYRLPSSIDEAIAFLEEDEGAMVLAGGQSLVPAMNMRLANPTRLVDIQRIPGLASIVVENGLIKVGAMTRHRDLELDDRVYKANPIIREALGHVAHVPIRNRGTIVGSLCHADASAEMPMLLVLTDGSVVAKGKSGVRTIAAKDFFEFHMTTTRRPGEIIVEAQFPVLPPGAGYSFEEFARRSGDFAIAAVGAIVKLGKDRTVEAVALAASGISSRPLRLEKAEAVLAGSKLSKSVLEEAGKNAGAAVTAADDMHATTAYRRHLVGVLLRKTVETAVSRAS